MQPRLQTKYTEEVLPKMVEHFGIPNRMAAPKLTKIVINMGCKGAVENKARVDAAAKDLGMIAGQKPTIRLARKSIAGFKLREGMPIGCAVTLRGAKMWEFADRLITFALPRTRDFKGVSKKAFDGRGNYTLGVKEQIIFPEIQYDKIDKIKGMNITFVTSATTDDHGRALLRGLGMPLKK